MFPRRDHVCKYRSFLVQIVSGHLQVDNCRFEASQVFVDHPATCHFRYCEFDHCNVTLSNVNRALFENCDFLGHVVSVQGFPKESRNWAHEHLLDLIRSGSYVERAARAGGRRCDVSAKQGFSDLSTLATSHSFRTVTTTHSSAFHLNKHDDDDSIGVASIDDDSTEDTDSSSSEVTSSSARHSICSFSSLSQNSLDSSQESTKHEHTTDTSKNKPNCSNHKPQPPSSRPISISSKTKITHKKLPTVAELQKLDDQASSGSSSLSESSASNRDDVDSRISARWSSDGESVVEAKLATSFEHALQTDASLRDIVEQATCVCFRKCRFQGDAGGLRLSQQAHCRVEGCQFKNLTFAVK